LDFCTYCHHISGDQFPMPRQQRLWRDDCRYLSQDFSAEPFGLHCKPATLIIGKTHAALADLLPHHTIFFNEIFDDLLRPLIHPTGDRDDEKGKWIQTRLHSGRLPRSELSSSRPSTIEFLDSTGTSEPQRKGQARPANIGAAAKMGNLGNLPE